MAGSEFGIGFAGFLGCQILCFLSGTAAGGAGAVSAAEAKTSMVDTSGEATIPLCFLGFHAFFSRAVSGATCRERIEQSTNVVDVGGHPVGRSSRVTHNDTGTSSGAASAASSLPGQQDQRVSHVFNPLNSLRKKPTDSRSLSLC